MITRRESQSPAFAGLAGTLALVAAGAAASDFDAASRPLSWLCLLVVVLYAALRYREVRSNILVSPVLISAVGLLICNIGETLLLQIGFDRAVENEDYWSVYLAVENFSDKAALYGVTGVAAFLFGSALVSGRADFNQLRRDYACDELLYKLAQWSFLMFGALFLFETIRLGRFATAYADSTAASSRLFINSMQLSLTASIIMAAAAGVDRRKQLHTLLLALANYLLLSYLGWRGHSAAFLVATLVVIGWNRSKIRVWWFVLCYLLASVLWFIIAETRSTRADDRDYKGALQEVAEIPRQILLYPIALLSGQELSLRYATLWHEQNGAGFGQWYVRSLRYIIPNLTSQERTVDLAESQSISVAISSRYVQRYGIALTPIGEALANFGIVGIMAVMAVFGAGMRSLEQSLINRLTVFKLCALGCILAAVLWWLRNDSMQLGRFALWGIAFAFLLTKIKQLFR